MTVLHIDFETRSTVDLKKTGVHVYAEDSTTDIWCAAYAFDDGPVHLWTPGQDFPDVPADIADHVSAGGALWAHNAAFERVIWRHILTPQYGWPLPRTDQWRCTMAAGLAMALPASLDDMAAALGLDVAKDRAGRALMLQMARPRKREADGSLVWWDDPDKLDRLHSYCRNDVIVERAIHARLLNLTDVEQTLWWLDQEINDRGLQVDEVLCNAALKVVEKATVKLNTAMHAVTEGAVTACSAVAQLTAWLAAQGVPTDTIKKGAVEELLARQDLPSQVREALELRQEAGKASVAKIRALLAGRSRDGRARGLVQYHAAKTGRWGGRRFQPQNLVRTDEDFPVPFAVQAILTGSDRVVDSLVGPPLDAVSQCIRGMVRAAPGHDLISVDFSNIEGRVLAWLAGEEWKLDAFREFDAGRAPDLYIQSYAKAFGVPLFDKKDPRRQVGKVMELASGYQGGHGAYLKMGATGAKLKALVAAARAATSDTRWEHAAELYDKRWGLSRDEWTGLRVVIDNWRRSHSQIVNFWYGLESAAIEAVLWPGSVVGCGKVRFRKAGISLWMQLPSGRCLSYPYPKVMRVKTAWGGEKDALTFKTAPTVSTKIVPEEGNSNRWARASTYGGSLAENATQAAARDLLRDAIFRAEKQKYPVVMHVHDELVCEVPKGFGSVDELARIAAELPAWAGGCPVAAAGWRGERYRK